MQGAGYGSVILTFEVDDVDAEYERLKLFDAGKSSLSPSSAPKLFGIFQSEGKFLDRYFFLAYFLTCLQLSN